MRKSELAQCDEAGHLAFEGAVLVIESRKDARKHSLFNSHVVEDIAAVAAHHTENLEGTVDVLLVAGAQGLLEEVENFTAVNGDLHAEV